MAAATASFLLLLSLLPSIATNTVLLAGNSTLTSPNHTFALGFFSPAGNPSSLYLAIWYASISLPTYVWVANRASPVLLPPAALALTPAGHLTLLDASNVSLWSSPNPFPGTQLRLLDTGNLLLLDGPSVVWQSFDHPADTWLPDMPMSAYQLITSWRSPSDPSPGLYHLRLRPPGYGEFELVYWNRSGTALPVPYWSTGAWLGDRFADVPEMTVPYIYDFLFDRPFTAAASFVYTTSPAGAAAGPLLTRFAVDSSGELRQYIWSAQAACWNMFWSRPEDSCSVHALCGQLGFCGRGRGASTCECLAGFRPANPAAWDGVGDFSDGCRMDRDGPCVGDEVEFMEIGEVEVDTESWFVYGEKVGRSQCEGFCRANCSCAGFGYDSSSRACKTMVGIVLNLRNSTAVTRPGFTVFLKAPASFAAPPRSNSSWRTVAIASGGAGGFLAAAGIGALLFAARSSRRRKRNSRKKRGVEEGVATPEDEGSVAATTHLQVFTYKELAAATKGFSEELGQGGFGAVFLGELPDSSQVAVKRLERPGGGDREFRAEVRTIGGIQHVNLVRLRGFCSEGPRRLLVYEYMAGGPLSRYLRRRAGGAGPPPLPWRIRFGIAVGTARGIAYLHEECRDCIIHCDIKPENILLDSGLSPRISDFGMAKLLGRDLSRVLTTMRGTWGYVAPEWISGVAITAKADVYSYGMTLLEILAGRRNVDAEEEGRWFLPPWAAEEVVKGNVGAVVDEGLAGEYDVEEAERVGRVAVWCIQDQEGARPSMGMVVKMLEGRVEVGVPPLPGLLQSLVAGDSFPKEGIATGGMSLSTPTPGSEGGSSPAAVAAAARVEVAGMPACPR